MVWTDIVVAFRDLKDSVGDPTELRQSWDRFRAVVEATGNEHPYHLRGLIRRIEEYRGDRQREDIVLLDHGCGGALTLLYLMALGYRDAYGVDIGDSKCVRWNVLTAQLFDRESNRFFIYDGRMLPIPDDAIDVVFSQEVLEHVHPDVLDSYYAEEHRVLRPNGLAIHSVPHRLVPFDSHTRTWFLHWILPRELWIRTLKAFGHDVRTAEIALFLRWPWIHRRLAVRHFGHVEDRTLERLRDLDTFEYYDGPAGLRRILTRLVRLPAVGTLLGCILAQFVMIDTISRNRA